MAQNEYIVEDRSFRTEADYKRALRDKETMDRLRKESAKYTATELESLLNAVHGGKYQFHTLLGQDFEDELAERVKQMRRQGDTGRNGKSSHGRQNSPKSAGSGRAAPKGREPAVHVSEEAVQLALKKQELRRRWTVLVCMAVAVVCLGYFGAYMYFGQRTDSSYASLAALKDKPVLARETAGEEVVIHYVNEEKREIPEVLDEYKNLLNKNKKLIGWVKIDDTDIDYPVMQTSDNEYYLDHNLNQEYDKNGSIFMDKDCDAIEPSTNLILYGHHMKSGKMFGGLDKYQNEEYYKKHRYIDFDTIYEKGVYEVMYVFRSRVYSEEEVVFKYYRFIDAVSEIEFNSNMNEMAAISLYDTGVTAEYGDRLLTLSTCDYQEQNGRFVVVAKKVSEKE
ncbi:MAG: class B sortase [Butyrivibrio sp.]|nr:class B sortase [Muribaculum sp.]MCM1551974.1 class B sortase [Butyrivibrio sp.]